MTDKLYTYDPAEALNSFEDIVVFIADAMETGNAAYIAKAVGIAANVQGFNELARETGFDSEQLHIFFSGSGDPTLKFFLSIIRALGLDLTVKPHTKDP